MTEMPPPPPDWNPPASSGPVEPCDNGIRFGAFLLEVLLTFATCIIGWLIWSIVLWQQSTTPAKKILGLRVVDTATGAPATMRQMVMREVVGKMAIAMALNLVLGGMGTDSSSNWGAIIYIVSGIMILVTANRQGIWDLIAKTSVVRAR